MDNYIQKKELQQKISKWLNCLLEFHKIFRIYGITIAKYTEKTDL